MREEGEWCIVRGDQYTSAQVHYQALFTMHSTLDYLVEFPTSKLVE